MALLNPLRATSSRLPLASSSVRRSLQPLTHPVLARHASTTSHVQTGSTVQDADAALAKMRKAEAMNRKNGAAVDMTGMATPVLEPLVEPPFSPAWLFRAGAFKYLQQRIQRFRATRQFLNLMIKQAGIEKRKGGNTFDSVVKSLQCLSPTFKAGSMVGEAKAAYIAYNKAQAAADEPALRAVSTAAALSSAQNVARTKREMSWDLVRTVTPPRVISARIGRFDSEGALEYAQVVVRFDSEQALTMTGRNGSQTKRQRVVENILFERLLPVRAGWKIKQRLEMTTPDFLR